MNQVVIRRLTVLCVELSTAQQWLAAQRDSSTVPDLASCACRALRMVDQLCQLTRRITSPGSRQWVYVDAVVSVARQLLLVLGSRHDLDPRETRAGVDLAIETLSLAARLGFSLARRRETCRRVAVVLVVWVWRTAVFCVSLLPSLCLVWIASATV